MAACPERGLQWALPHIKDGINGESGVVERLEAAYQVEQCHPYFCHNQAYAYDVSYTSYIVFHAAAKTRPCLQRFALPRPVLLFPEPNNAFSHCLSHSLKGVSHSSLQLGSIRTLFPNNIEESLMNMLSQIGSLQASSLFLESQPRTFSRNGTSSICRIRQ